jgi:DNA-binding NtrC family response regulator
MMEAKQFRRDLFYRLCVVPIRLLPLRDRCMDIPVLVEHFLESIAEETGRPQISLTNEALDLLINYPWPGNVRELRNALQYVCEMPNRDSGPTIFPGDPELRGETHPVRPANPAGRVLAACKARPINRRR